MNPKQLLTLIAIFAILFFAVMVKQLHHPPELVTEEFSALDLAFDVNQIGKIEIFKGEKPQEGKVISLEKKPAGQAGWRVRSLWDARGDQEKINQFLSEIRNAKGEIRGKDASLFPDFGIGDPQAFHLRLMNPSGKDILHLLVGTKKAGAGTIFIRRKDSAMVFLTEADLFGKMGVFGEPGKEEPESDFWASTQLMNADEASVTRFENVRFKDGKGIVTSSVALEADPYDSTKKLWKFQREGIPFSPDPDRVKQFLTAFKTWRAQKVMNPADYKETFNSPVWRMSLWKGREEPVVLIAGKKDETAKAYPIKVSTEPAVFQLSQYFFENMDIDDSKFFSDNLLKVDPAKTEKLVIHTEKQELSFEPKTKTFDALKNYLNGLQSLNVVRLFFDPGEKSQVRSPGSDWIEIKAEGLQSQILDVSGKMTKDAKEFPAVIRGTAHPFLISDKTYGKLFEGLDKLKETK
jgi:hypothetical protein